MTTTKTEFAFRQVTDVSLTNVNFRKELHGDDHVQAVDLTMAVDVPNTLLDTIVPGLRQALYHNATAESGQEAIEGVEETLPNLRFPRLNGGKFALDDKKNKLAGYELFIDYGLGDDRSNMLFDCCKVVKRAIETKEGGTVHMTWQVQYSGDRLDQATCGKPALRLWSRWKGPSRSRTHSPCRMPRRHPSRQATSLPASPAPTRTPTNRTLRSNRTRADHVVRRNRPRPDRRLRSSRSEGPARCLRPAHHAHSRRWAKGTRAAQD